MNRELYIKFKATHSDAILPEANNTDNGTGDSGYDLVAVEDVKIPAAGSNIVGVGLTLADITPGYWIRIEPRSGLGFKHSIQPHLGVIDNGYRGDLGVKLYNFSKNDHYVVKKGQKIAQLVMYKLLQPKCEWATEVTDTPRGEKGFGSSDSNNISTSAIDHTTTSYESYNGNDGTNPWAFEKVETLIKWAKGRPEIDNDIFSDMVRNTIRNREARS